MISPWLLCLYISISMHAYLSIHSIGIRNVSQGPVHACCLALSCCSLWCHTSRCFKNAPPVAQTCQTCRRVVEKCGRQRRDWSDSSGHVKTFAMAHGFTAASRKDLLKSWLKSPHHVSSQKLVQLTESFITFHIFPQPDFIFIFHYCFRISFSSWSFCCAYLCQELEQIADELLHSLTSRLQEQSEQSSTIDALKADFLSRRHRPGCEWRFPAGGDGDDEAMWSWKHGHSLIEIIWDLWSTIKYYKVLWSTMK